MGNMFKQLGASQSEAAGLSKEMVELSADLASFHNVAGGAEEVLLAMQSAFRGEYDALQRYIPTIKAAAVQQQALADTGKSSAKELTELEKALAAQAIILRDAGDALGDFARTSDEYANQQRILAAQMEDLSATVGQSLLPVMTETIGRVNDWVGANDKLIAQNVAGAIKGVATATQRVAAIYEAIPADVVGAAGTGLLGRVLFGATPPGRLAAALLVVNQQMAALSGSLQGWDFSFQRAVESFKEAYTAVTQFGNALLMVAGVGQYSGFHAVVHAADRAAMSAEGFGDAGEDASEKVHRGLVTVIDDVEHLHLAFEETAINADHVLGDLEYAVERSVRNQMESYSKLPGATGIYYERTVAEAAIAMADLEYEAEKAAGGVTRAFEDELPATREVFYSVERAFSDVVVGGIVDGTWDIQSAWNSMLKGMLRAVVESGLEGLFSGGGSSSEVGGWLAGFGGGNWGTSVLTGVLTYYGLKAVSDDDSLAAWAGGGVTLGAKTGNPALAIIGGAGLAIIGANLSQHEDSKYLLVGKTPSSAVGDPVLESELIGREIIEGSAVASGRIGPSGIYAFDTSIGDTIDAETGKIEAAAADVYAVATSTINTYFESLPSSVAQDLSKELERVTADIDISYFNQQDDPNKMLEEWAAQLSEEFTDAVDEAIVALGYESADAFEAYVARISAAATASATVITDAFSETLAAGGGFDDFATSLKGNVYHSVLDGLTEAFMQSQIIQDALQPTMLAVKDAFEEASIGGRFDMDVYNTLIGPTLAGLPDQIAALEPVFANMSGIVDTVQASIYGDTFANIDSRRTAVQSEYDRRLAEIERMEDPIVKRNNLRVLERWYADALATIPSYASGGPVNQVMSWVPLVPAGESGIIAAQTGETVLSREDTANLTGEVRRQNVLLEKQNEYLRLLVEGSTRGRRLSANDGLHLFAEMMRQTQITGAGTRYAAVSPVEVG